MKSYKNSKYHTIIKPWGKEILIECNDNFAIKEIFIKKGYRSSLQSHNIKIETLYLISGKIKLHIFKNSSKTLTEIIKTGESYSIPKKTKHRIIALENSRLFEVSTPYLDDIIRYEDDYNRVLI